MKKAVNLTLILKGIILDNEQLKDMFDSSEEKYESSLSFNDLQLWYLDIIEIDLSNYLYENQLEITEINLKQWLFGYFNDYLTNDIIY